MATGEEDVVADGMCRSSTSVQAHLAGKRTYRPWFGRALQPLSASLVWKIPQTPGSLSDPRESVF